MHDKTHEIWNFRFVNQIIDSMADGVFTMDADGRISSWNRSMERISGYTANEAIGKTCAVFRFSRCFGKECPAGIMKCGIMTHGSSGAKDCLLQHKEGHDVPVIKSASVVRDEEENILGVVETVTDLTELKKARRKAEEAVLKLGEIHRMDNIIGKSQAMRNVFAAIKAAASSNATVLVQGESGTGKELVAKAIHRLSARKDKPIVTINCAGIPENLIESELFGYKKGAFTGAATDKDGLFDVADGGTVFLDEVGELTPAIQVKLLRVIQERTFTAVGGTEEKNVDVRFISATNKDLEQEVIENNFREDLYFRLNVIHIDVPPLRKRDGDLPLLSQHFLEKYSQELEKEIKKISAYAMDILGQYSFPGNVRELENIIERSVALETSNIVLPESLTLSDFRGALEQKGRRRLDLSSDGISLDEIMAEIERDYILKAMEMAHGSKQRAADLLGVSMRSLRYRLDKLGLQSSSNETF